MQGQTLIKLMRHKGVTQTKNHHTEHATDKAQN